jgi:hypothetical protein
MMPDLLRCCIMRDKKASGSLARNHLTETLEYALKRAKRTRMTQLSPKHIDKVFEIVCEYIGAIAEANKRKKKTSHNVE